jgi:hypothetical protein
MRIYRASSEEALRVRQLLAEWESEGFLARAQYKLLEPEVVSELRTTNIFLRLVLFFFTLISVGAAIGLFFEVLRPSDRSVGVFFLVVAVLCYTAAEIAVSQGRLYRFGIEEALVAGSLAFLCLGLQVALFSGSFDSAKPDAAECMVPAFGAIFSLWIWRRFGLSYAFLDAMIFVIFLPGKLTTSHAAQHVAIAAFYTAALVTVVMVRHRHHFDYLDRAYSLVEALLWFGIYLTFNLQLLSLVPRTLWMRDSLAAEFPRPFYWTTWALIWCLPPIVIARGVRLKDRFVIAVGAIIATLTFVSNKPYLGWPRHTWDPMILGLLLTSVAVYLRGWLARGPGGIRHGFTAARLSGKDKQWMDVGSTVVSLMSPYPAPPGPPTKPPDFRFGGGSTGGGGAGGDF